MSMTSPMASGKRGVWPPDVASAQLVHGASASTIWDAACAEVTARACGGQQTGSVAAALIYLLQGFNLLTSACDLWLQSVFMCGYAQDDGHAWGSGTTSALL